MEARQKFLGWTGCLLDPKCSPGEHRQAAHDWCGWAMRELGIEENSIGDGESPAMVRTDLPSGQAISPQRAALCVREHQRTAVFLQAMAAAIRAARERFPGETIHVVEAGCGPLAALTLPFMARHAPGEVDFTLIDFHEVSLAGVRRLAETLGVAASVRACIAGDAAAVRFAEAERPHIVACEVLRRALKKEPQVAVTQALAPQLREGGFFLPERIEVDLGILHGGRQLRRFSGESDAGEPEPIERIGRVFCLDAYRTVDLEVLASRRIKAGCVSVAPQAKAHPPLQLFTRLTVFREHTLGDFDCSLTTPERLRYPAELTARGGVAKFSYEISGDPGLRLEVAKPVDTNRGH